MLEADGFAAALDSALVMPFAGASKTGLEQVVTDQRRKSLGQFSLRTDDALSPPRSNYRKPEAAEHRRRS